ncbi:hypothetical protein C8R46DRAFT_386 [Mycena filopes]|nr:hypothetical protein C8R46DRAFT_386 [Mycena filopes]
MNRGKFVPFFAKLGLPALQTLDLSCFYAREPWPANFSIFQSRAPNIKHISLRGCPRHSSELIDLLRLIPALIKLTLVHMNCLDSLFLQAFSCDGVNTKRLVPQLCELDWWGHEENLSGAPALIAAIRWRWSATSSSAVRLRAVKLSGLDASMAEGLCRSVEDLVAQGLKFEIA